MGRLLTRPLLFRFLINYRIMHINLKKLFILIITFSIQSCNTNDSNSICDITKEKSLLCNGGYSYWISQLAVESNNVIAMTGVYKADIKSRQWVVFVERDLSKVLAEIKFKERYKADEHNAPAVLHLDDGSWIVARTGHNDIFSLGRGLIELSFIDQKFRVTRDLKLFLENGASYTQLLEANDVLYLLTRDTKNGWGMFTSNDYGGTWSEWSAINLPKGRNYVLLTKDASAEYPYEKLVLNIGKHPLDDNQNIAFSYLDYSADGLKLKSENGGLLTKFDSNGFISQLLINQETSTRTRFLDAQLNNQGICHLYSTKHNLVETETETWDLNIVVRKDVTAPKRDYFIGEFQGVLGNSAYIIGASIKRCNLNDGESIEVLVTHKDLVTSEYVLSLILIDAQTGIRLDSHVVYRSEKVLYRPQYIKATNHVMFNEAIYWNTYENWSANQILMSL